MEYITLIIGLFFAVISLNSKGGTAMGILMASALVWPDYLRFPVFGIQMSATRIVAIVLLIKSLIRSEYRLGKLNTIDKLIILNYLWDIFANIMIGTDFSRVKESIGRGLDTILIYFVTRFMVRSKNDLRGIIYPLIFCGVILGTLGVYESITFFSPYQYLLRFHTWVWVVRGAELRLGMLRAFGSSSHPIYFGMAMFFLLGILISLRGVALNAQFKSKKIIFKLGVLGALAALFSSMSSGPIVSGCSLLALNALFYKRSLIKPFIKLLIFAGVCIELLSNRHFYHMVDYISLSSHTAWYRTKLLEVAIQQLHEYWLLGFKEGTPNHWGALIDGRKHVDLVNNYVYLAVVSGLPGVILFMRIQIKAIKNTLLIWKTGDEDLRRFAFGMCCLIVSYIIGSMSVSIFGAALILSYVVYGLASNNYN